ncbi:MAG TPA: hypothetical protein ENG80_03250, partial [Nitrospirae bacterium]|nr:hypothetical protein [Nitrospirota bacterium]
MKHFFLFLVFVLVVVGVLHLLSGNDYPIIPADPDHTGITDAAVCMECHGPEEEKAMKGTH